MSVKTILILCAQALLVKFALSQCTSRAAVADISGLAGPYGLAAPGLAGSCGLGGSGLAYDGLAYPGAGFAGSGLAYNGLNAGYGSGIYGPAIEFAATSGGALPVSSASAIAPVGISVLSDNVYEGPLVVGGELPFVGTVAMEGVVPSAGAGAVNHACGNGINAMISDTTAFAPGAYGPAGATTPAGALGAAAPFGYGAGLGGLAYPAAVGLAGPIAGSGLGYRGGCGCGL